MSMTCYYIIDDIKDDDNVIKLCNDCNVLYRK